MASYFARGNIAGGVKAQLADLKSKYFSGADQLKMTVGLTESLY